MKTLLLAALGFLLLAGSAHAATADAAASEAQIKLVIDSFQSAIIKKDKAALSALFLPANNSWIAVPTEATYRVVHGKHPKARRFMPGSYTEFVDFVAASPERMEEKFSNVNIETDGAVASVYFDFVFLSNGEQQNHGSETWQLINTGSGWKINALVYSINVDPAQVK
jgi:opacity protein-like surface antigen